MQSIRMKLVKKANLLPFKERYRAFYGNVRGMQKVRSHVAQLKIKDNTLTGKDEEVTNELFSFFTSVFVKEGDTDGPEIEFVSISKPTNSMLDFNISVDDVCKKLKQLKYDKFLGQDGIQENGRDSCTASKTDF